MTTKILSQTQAETIYKTACTLNDTFSCFRSIVTIYGGQARNNILINMEDGSIEITRGSFIRNGSEYYVDHQSFAEAYKL